MEQLQRLRPVYHNTKHEREELGKAKANAGVARQGIELMSKLRHIPGFFPTPPAIVEQMISLAGVHKDHLVLEPSVGKGNIALAVMRFGVSPFALQCVEKNYDLFNHCKGLGLAVEHQDFLEWETVKRFDRVLMNPPFERKQDIAHVKHAFTFLKPGGRLVSIVSSTSGALLEDWAADHDGYVEPLAPGSFATSERPAGVSCSIVVAEASE